MIIIVLTALHAYGNIRDLTDRILKTTQFRRPIGLTSVTDVLAVSPQVTYRIGS